MLPPEDRIQLIDIQLAVLCFARRIRQKRRREIPDSSLLTGYLHLAPLQGGEDAAFGKGCKAREGGLGF